MIAEKNIWKKTIYSTSSMKSFSSIYIFNAYKIQITCYNPIYDVHPLQIINNS